MKLKFYPIVAALLFVTTAFKSQSQAYEFNAALNPAYFYIFDYDSLRGFDEDAARKALISQHFLGQEFKYMMYVEKRSYINNKYNLWPKQRQVEDVWTQALSSAVVPGCLNEDFEASTAGAVTASNQVTGWTVTRGTHNTVAGSDACNLLACCPQQPVESAVITAPAAGFIDPNIGAGYPIYSVFGSTPAPAAAAAANPQILQGMFGSTFFRLNSQQTGDLSIEKISKTFSVTPSNALVQFAYILVFNGPHTCCTSGSFKVRILNASANTVVPCPAFTVYAANPNCAQFPTSFNLLQGPSNTNNYPAYTATSTGFPNSVFNKWNINSLDLSPYIGQNITLEFTISDCTASGHYSYCYFDAQCGPMVVYGNNTPFDAGSGNVVVPTCGASGATICAQSGLGPYSWAGPNIPTNSPLATPAYSNNCFTTTLTATYTLYMNPAGACAPITRVVQSTVTPAPAIFSGITQATCGSSLAVVQVTPSGSAANPASLIWSPSPFTINSTSTTAQYTLPVGANPITVTISVVDPVGCKMVTTESVLPAPPIPTVAIQNASPSYSIMCNNPVVNLNAVSGYTYGTLNYFWSSPSATFNSSAATATNPGNYSVTVTDPVTLCSKTETTAVYMYTTAPVSAITPTFQNITCNVTSVAMVTLTASSPTVSVSQTIFDPLGGSYVNSGTQSLYQPGAIGIFTAVTTNEINGCTTTKTFVVNSNQGFPTFSLTSPQNFTLGCFAKAGATINIVNGQATNSLQVPTGGPVTYTLLGPSTSTSIVMGTTLSTSSTYTITQPGTYTVITRDNSSYCDTRLPISIIQYTNGPTVDKLDIPQQILTCETRSVQLEAGSLTPNTGYAWSIPNSGGTQASSLVVVNANFTAPTATLIGDYTLTLTDGNSTCRTTTVVKMQQNLFVPRASISNGGVPALSCKTTSLTLTNQSSSGIPANSNIPISKPVVALAWYGPSPQASLGLQTTYVGLVSGVYTMTARDMNNGCESTTVITINDDREYPNVQMIPQVLDCGNSAKQKALVRPLPGKVTFLWSTPDGVPFLGSNTDSIFEVKIAGRYGVVVTNTNNGCATATFVSVESNSILTAEFDVDVEKGYAPLTVNITNKSQSANGSSSITSTWNFGNGTSASTKSVSVPLQTTFKQPGTYTITLMANKGECAGSGRKVIVVDIPSKLTVPNVFTPNGDGVNDIYFLKISNLEQLEASIYDRWGHIVYTVDTKSTKNNKDLRDNVNISWDGKNQFGVDLPEGTYFYIIKATGKDGKAYEEKGNITLLR